MRAEEASRNAAELVEAWTGELRVNAIRLVAILAFYGNHLVQRYALGVELPEGYHAAVSGLTAAWTLGALAIHLLLGRRTNPAWLRYFAAGLDALMIALLLVLSDGPRSPLVALLFLSVATSALRLDLGLVWAATGLAIAAYAVACGHARWVRPELRVPREQQAILVIALVCAGLLAGQSVRQARRLARRRERP